MIRKICNTFDAELLYVDYDDNAAEEVQNFQAEVDVFLVNYCNSFDGRNCDLIAAVAGCNSGWVEVFGFNSEAIHDEIDRASVRAGRQQAVGDGVPMTSWNDDPIDIDFCRIKDGGHGVADIKLLIVIGSSDEQAHFLKVLEETEID